MPPEREARCGVTPETFKGAVTCELPKGHEGQHEAQTPDFTMKWTMRKDRPPTERRTR